MFVKKKYGYYNVVYAKIHIKLHGIGYIPHIHVIYYDLMLVQTFSYNSRKPDHFSRKSIYRIQGSRYSVPHAKVFDNVGSL